jgi:signal transduction histidine kinase
MTQPPTRLRPAADAPPRAAAAARAAREPVAPGPLRRATALTHELQVHRIELEMQNEELRRAHVALEAARDRYIDLYDFAPVGYLTLDEGGTVVEANLTATAQLDVDRARLLGRRFARHVALVDRDRWHRHALALRRSDAPSRIELLLLGPGGDEWHAQIDGLRAQEPGAKPVLRIALTDITLRRRAELQRSAAAAANAAREADNRRLALQLHEDLGQRLCALKLDLDALHDSEERPARMLSMGKRLDDAVTLVRRMSADLRPAMLDDLGLNAAIDWLVHDTCERLGVAVSLKQDDIEPPLDETSAVAIYRLVQAVLDRLASPERVSDATLSVRRQLPGMVVSLCAKGLEPGDLRQATTLSERALALGGRLATEFDAPGASCITVRVPLEAVEPGRHLRVAGGWP